MTPGIGRGAVFLAGVVCAVSVLAAERAPHALVERVVDRAGTAYRLTLFDNGVVVAKRRAEDATVVRRRRLTDPEFEVYLRLFRDAAGELAGGELPGSRGGPGRVVVTVPGLPEVTVRYDPDRSYGMALSRLLTALDDIEKVTFETRPEEEAIRAWEPQRGQVVELYSGARARVEQVRDSGVIVLRYLDQPLVEALRREDAVSVVRRVVEVE